MDARIATMTNALREHGATAPMLDTDSLAKALLDTLDREHGAGDLETQYWLSPDDGKTWREATAEEVGEAANT